MVQTRRTGAWGRRFLVTVVALALAVSGSAHAQAPRLGEVHCLTVITLSLQVGSTETTTRQVTYTPPPGWYVRSHAVTCTRQYGRSSFSVNTVPRDWNWHSETRVQEVYKARLDLAGKAQNAGIQGKLRCEREERLAESRRVRSSHHALVVEATAKGEGFLRGGGGLQLTVTAELVYVGTTEDPGKTIARFKSPGPLHHKGGR